MSYDPDVVITKLSISLTPDSEEDSSKSESILDLTIISKKIQDIVQFVKVIQREIEFKDEDTQLILNKFIKDVMTRVQLGT